ncbi:flavin-containing monooxygenase [[Mycobacterium] nativiensis]|uniref:NAD(P)/FAD-dependent oxidoreductase n=1 Tax=[Mycobacterium] nativiensis TaxID=2855503 RepID=A0ABU5XVB7_9MYCO|nr:NAD(P)/FAD-dependent oxidoreductase [Mycolicibacter sp. MYC340]MEB3031885.1 NAD(P)/FAD-dependent oxidoreductase [Mycolicibacter sp. MYC340]
MRTTHHQVGIIGAGFGGIGTAIRLKQSGNNDFVVLERAPEAGGTWQANTYPGAQCDIPSALYSFSFAANPDWTRLYPLQSEIKSYLEACVKRYGIAGHLRFGADVAEATWNDDSQLWHVTTAGGQRYTFSTLVAATGPFSQPNTPEFDGMDDFTGPVLHSARWDHSCDLTRKRVAVIGTGASAVQLIPQIQPAANRLVVFQRTPTWIMPHPDQPIRPSVRRAFRRWPMLQSALRRMVHLLQEMMVPALVYRPALVKPFEALGRWHLRHQVADPMLRETLTPRYAFGCKRPTFSNKYFPALAAPNTVVETAGIECITASGIKTRDGRHHELDAIILATGFNIVDNEFFTRVRGRDGRTLAETWSRDGLQTHLGTCITGFPNFYTILGPNSAIYTSQVVTIEAQVAYIMSALDLMARRNLRSIEVRDEIQQHFVNRADRILEGSVWNSGGCSSYYLGRDGRNFTFWPGFAFTFQNRMRRVRPGDFVVRLAGRPAAEQVAR